MVREFRNAWNLAYLKIVSILLCVKNYKNGDTWTFLVRCVIQNYSSENSAKKVSLIRVIIIHHSC
jgi:hypothetical protein